MARISVSTLLSVTRRAIAGDILLRLSHRLMRRTLRTKAVPVFGKRPVPPAWQNLHHRLLDKPGQHRGNAQRAHSPVRLGDLDPSHRLGLIRPAQQLFPDRWPALLQVARQLADSHAVDSRTPLIGLHSS